jgi:hypothetical protein
MNLVCKTCNAVIGPGDTNIGEGVCTCRQCGGFFKISALLTEDAVITRIAKPAYSLVEFFSDRDSLGLIIPRGRSRGMAFFFFFFALFWNALSWTMFTVALYKRETPAVFFLLIFVTIGAGLALAALYSFYGEFSLLADRSTCRAVWTLFKWNRTKSLPTTTITAVTEEVVYTKNYVPVYGVGLKAGSKTLKFGSALTEEERKWIVGELRHFLGVKG